jgi:hypothetical protein
MVTIPAGVDRREWIKTEEYRNARKEYERCKWSRGKRARQAIIRCADRLLWRCGLERTSRAMFDEVEISYSVERPVPHVDLKLRNGSRVTGYVYPELQES